mgnify:CR=1 FL=1
MNESKLMSYITSDFSSKSDMRVGAEEWQAIIQEMLPKFKKAGAIRQTVSQIWNKEGVFRIGRIFMYKDEKAFIACQKIFREFENENSDINRKISSSRGIVLDENILI